MKALAGKLILVCSIIIASVFIYGYGKSKTTLYGDAFGYYLYLPSTFIHNNIVAPYTTPIKGLNDGTQWYFKIMSDSKRPDGNYLNQYTYGIALLEAPFFFIAHIYEHFRHGAANGYSSAYENMLKVGNFIYLLLGLMFVYKILKRYFSTNISLITISCLFLCTNLFWFGIFQAGMSHIPLFFLYSALVFATIKIYEDPQKYLFALIGLIAGIITLIRPTDIVCLLIPALYGVYNKDTFQKKLAFISRHRLQLFIALMIFFLPLVPQLFYWKAVTGHWFVYSYGDQSFDFRHPKIIEGLFYFKNGWIPYSPIMLFAFAGMFFSRTFALWKWCIIILFCVYVYIIYSWNCYYYLNGLGSRPMIHLYPLLALPLAATLKFIAERKIISKVIFGSVILFFASMNLCYSIQQQLQLIDSNESNMAFNFQMLFRSQLTYDDLIVKDIGEWQPNSAKLKKVATLMMETFEDTVDADIKSYSDAQQNHYFEMHDIDYLEVGVITFSKEKFKNSKWFRVGGSFMSPDYIDYYRHILVLDINNKDKLWRGLSIENNIPDQAKPAALRPCVVQKWGDVSYFCKVPRGLEDGDIIRVILWTTDKRRIYMDNVFLELYR